ncbi:hypothetical protein G6F58_013432 [Rhizopus delemar]|nr:hypothetical protein G6F58_013432 [Rhizopus delemar]
MHRLAPKVEPLQAAMQHHGAVGDQRVRQGVLAQRTRVVHVHQQAEEERGEEPHSARLVHAPEGDDQQQHPRRKRRGPDRTVGRDARCWGYPGGAWVAID